MMSIEQKLLQRQLQIEKIKALDIANKAIIQAQNEYQQILKYYQSLGI